MKRILCAIVLLGFTTALHAVTYTWDANSNTFKNGEETIGAYTNITKLVIIVSCARTSDTFQTNYFALTQQGSDANLLKFGVSGALGQITIADNSTLSGGGHWSAARAGADKSFTTTFTFDSRDASGIFQKLVASYAFTTAGASESDTWSNNAKANFNGKSFGGLTAFEGTTISSASIEIEGTLVPEPGALALLALGGAGLVLRRKVRA